MRNGRRRANSHQFLFVYGTLTKTFARGWHTKVKARFVGEASITARLYDLGDYPGAKLSDEDSGPSVRGELYRLNDPKLALRTLDEYEEFLASAPRRSLFVRELVDVTLEGGRKQRAWAYLYNRAVGKARLIPSGDYRDVMVGS